MALDYSDAGLTELAANFRKVAWNQGYKFRFTWLGVPIIQMPHDIVRLQELIFKIQPLVIIETGVAYGGSIVLYASILRSLGLMNGSIYGIDPNPSSKINDVINHHPACQDIDIHLIAQSSIDQQTVEQIKNRVDLQARKFISLDSKHTYDHVYQELNIYSAMMRCGDYLLVQDTAITLMHDTPRGVNRPKWRHKTCAQALQDFLDENPNFQLQQQQPIFSKHHSCDDQENSFSFHPSGLIKCVSNL